MKTNKKIMIYGLMMVVIVLIGSAMGYVIKFKEKQSMTNSKQETTNQEKQKFDVHEWGVFYQKYNDNVIYVQNPNEIKDFIINESDSRIRPFKPVIYFHSEDNISYITVEVNISEDLITIPNATIIGNKIRWTFALENNSILLENGSLFKYLFYEGKINYTSPIISYVVVDDSNVTFYVKNIGYYPISNIFFTYSYPINPFPIYPIGPEFKSALTYVFIERIEPGQEIILTKSKNSSINCFNYTLIQEILNNSGLTQQETNDLIEYWSNIWFEPNVYYSEERGWWRGSATERAQILYMIPEYAYDELLPINITPQPETIKRVGLFYITDIPIHPSVYVQVETNKTEYTPGENIELIIKNLGSKIVYFGGSSCLHPFPDYPPLERYVNGSWVSFKLIQNYSGPCAEVIVPPCCLEPRTTRKIVIPSKYRIYNPNGFEEYLLPEGIYRFSITFGKSYPKCKIQDTFTVYSNEFSIKTNNDESKKSLSFVTLFGCGHPFYKRDVFVIKNQSDWKKYECECSTIDFNQSMVIVVAMGSQTSGGYSITITKIIENVDSIHVYIKERRPNPGEAVIGVITFPSHIVVLKKSDKPVVFLNIDGTIFCPYMYG